MMSTVPYCLGSLLAVKFPPSFKMPSQWSCSLPSTHCAHRPENSKPPCPVHSKPEQLALTPLNSNASGKDNLYSNSSLPKPSLRRYFPPRHFYPPSGSHSGPRNHKHLWTALLLKMKPGLPLGPYCPVPLFPDLVVCQRANSGSVLDTESRSSLLAI